MASLNIDQKVVRWVFRGGITERFVLTPDADEKPVEWFFEKHEDLMKLEFTKIVNGIEKMVGAWERVCYYMGAGGSGGFGTYSCAGGGGGSSY
jgi:hypothetical protein